MKHIINNHNNLDKKDIKHIVNKVRIAIIDKENNIIITNYSDMYMLPGGKIDQGETKEEAIQREIKEELGITIDTNQLEELLEIKNYLKDYPIRNTKKTSNRLTTTTYYLIELDTLEHNLETNLTEHEQNGQFKTEIVNITNLNSILEKPSSNPRNEIFKEELKSVIKELEYVEMHIHSTHSDGEFTPEELVKQAINQNIKTFALTDHDCIRGNIDILNSTPTEQINFISGIEFSGLIDKGRLHILGYDIDIKNPTLNKRLEKYKLENHNYVRALIEILQNDYNIHFSNKDINKLFKQTNNLGRADLAKLCVKNNYTINTTEAFEQYLNPAYKQVTTHKGILPTECLSLIIASGGIPVLAHPYTLEKNNKDLEAYIKFLKENGLEGIEVYRPDHTEEQSKTLLNIANKLNLLTSAGSDYHGIQLKPHHELRPYYRRKQLTLLNKLDTRKGTK